MRIHSKIFVGTPMEAMSFADDTTSYYEIDITNSVKPMS